MQDLINRRINPLFIDQLIERGFLEHYLELSSGLFIKPE